jgi:tetratricopeptide (TPR) repeat protein
MSDIHPGLIEKYQLALEKDPRSQVFAPLSEAYRKMGLLEEAFRISSRGVQFHPQFAGGHIALANVLMEKGQFENAKESLEKAVQLSPENILAFQKLGECCLHLKQGKQALKAFKMVLLFSPTHPRALQAVQKLETLTADEFEDDVFKMDRISSLGHEENSPEGTWVGGNLEVLVPTIGGAAEAKVKDLERQLSLIDAYMVRGQFLEARELAERNFERYPKNKAIEKRLSHLKKATPSVQSQELTPEARSTLNRNNQIRDEKIKLLKKLLVRVREENDQQNSLV